MPKIFFKNPNLDYSRDGVLVLMVVGIMATGTWILRGSLLHPLSKLLIREQSIGRPEKQRRILPRKSKVTKETLRSTPQPNNVSKMNADQLNSKRIKFVVAATKMISYLGLLLVAFLCLRNETEWFLNPFVQHVEFTGDIPIGVRILYLMETSYYFYTLFAMFYEPRMKDRNQMVIHHIFTLFLLLTSYHYNGVKYGASIIVLHDLSDPLMEAAKLFNYVGNEMGANIFFVLFALSFFYLRLWIYPSQIILATFLNMRNYPYYPVTLMCLSGLWVLHMIWSYMICQVIYRSIFLGQMGDVRDED